MAVVTLVIYDLSKWVSRKVLPMLDVQFEHIYHSSVIVFDEEFWFCPTGIERGLPGNWDPTNKPIEQIDMGLTTRTIEDFEEFLLRLKTESLFEGENYHVILKNCLHFSEAILSFLVAMDVPMKYLDIPEQFLESKFVKLLLRCAAPREEESQNNAYGYFHYRCDFKEATVKYNFIEAIQQSIVCAIPQIPMEEFATRPFDTLEKSQQFLKLLRNMNPKLLNPVLLFFFFQMEKRCQDQTAIPQYELASVVRAILSAELFSEPVLQNTIFKILTNLINSNIYDGQYLNCLLPDILAKLFLLPANISRHQLRLMSNATVLSVLFKNHILFYPLLVMVDRSIGDLDESSGLLEAIWICLVITKECPASTDLLNALNFREKLLNVNAEGVTVAMKEKLLNTLAN